MRRPGATHVPHHSLEIPQPGRKLARTDVAAHNDSGLLLERDAIVSELEAYLRDAAAGAGRIVAISGEAGVGKTSLVEQFAASHANDVRALRGLCDPLTTPRPLGPLYDMVHQTEGPLAATLRENAGRESLFSAFLAELGRAPSPRLVVVEDVHWADDATLDLLKFLGRRIRRVPALLLVTYRDDEITPEHPLHHLLGEMPRDSVRWLRLPLLSEAAVCEMARRSGRPGEGLYALTGGNPFFVSEVLASSCETCIPHSIREAVLARATRLSADARDFLDLVSVSPGRMAWRLLERLADAAPLSVKECTASGVLATAGDTVGFRHELARLAWQDALEPSTRTRLHARILQALLDGREEDRNLARIVHHADGADDFERVLRFAPAAAQEAVSVGAHRQAASHYATALCHAGTLAPSPRASLLEAYAYERHLAGGIDDAVRARTEALTLRRSLDDRRNEGANLRWLSRLRWFRGQHEAAEKLGEEAIGVLEPIGPTPELAMAYSNLSQLHMLSDHSEAAIAWGERAIALAGRLGDTESLVHALTNVGSAEILTAERATGIRRLERAIDLALQHGFHEHALRAYGNIATRDVRMHDYSRAAAHIEQSLRLAAEYEIETSELYITGWRAKLELQRGDWSAAERTATGVIDRHHPLSVLRLLPLVVLGLLRARRGASGADAMLDEAATFALPTREVQRIAPAVSARAEAAWLRDDLAEMRTELRSAHEIALRSSDRWARGELAMWMRRAGERTDSADDLPEPFARELAGDWMGAAKAWERLGAPYERALALAAGDTPSAWQDALALLDGLGASATAGAVRRDLRRRGVRGVPRGPRQATRRNPAGLTPGQVRVLTLLARGISNGDIARELYLSPRTVDHHVSAILARLGVTTRSAAIAAAHERRLLSPT